MEHLKKTVRNITFGDGAHYPICLSFMPKTAEEIRPLSEEYRKAAPDMIEWRMDHLEDLCDRIRNKELVSVLKTVRECFPETVLLVTCRTKEEGGNVSICPALYTKMVRQILEEGREETDLLDVEFARKDAAELAKDLAGEDVGLVFSFHDFSRTPEDEVLEQKLKDMVREGALIAKIAVMPESEADVERLLNLTRRVDDELSGQCLLMTISMGSLGTVSRIRGKEYGSVFTFAGLTGGTVSAPGQIGIKELKDLIR